MALGGMGIHAKDIEPVLAEQYGGVTLRHFATMTSGYDSIGGSYEFDAQGRGDSWNPGPPFFFLHIRPLPYSISYSDDFSIFEPDVEIQGARCILQ